MTFFVLLLMPPAATATATVLVIIIAVMCRSPEMVKLSNEFHFLASTVQHCMCLCSAMKIMWHRLIRSQVHVHTCTHSDNYNYETSLLHFCAHVYVYICIVWMRAFYLLNIQIKLSNRQFSGFYIFCFVCIHFCALRSFIPFSLSPHVYVVEKMMRSIPQPNKKCLYRAPVFIEQYPCFIEFNIVWMWMCVLVGYVQCYTILSRRQWNCDVI